MRTNVLYRPAAVATRSTSSTVRNRRSTRSMRGSAILFAGLFGIKPPSTAKSMMDANSWYALRIVEAQGPVV